MKVLFGPLPPVLALVILFASISFAQISRPSVYIEPQQGLEGHIAASIAKKSIPIDVVSDRAKAIYVLSVSPIKMITVSSAVVMGEAFDSFETKNAHVSVELSERMSDQVVWVYTVSKPAEGRKTEQSMADLVAGHFKKFVEKNRGMLGGSARLQHSHGASLFGSAREQFLIPDGYEGDVYVVYGAADGESLSKTWGEIIYRIPQGGVLRIREPMPPGSTGTEYYYEQQDGSLWSIPTLRAEFGSPNVPLMPTSVMNGGHIGASFPHSGTFRDSTGCRVQFKQFYVGTSASLLSKYHQVDLGRYLRGNPVPCPK
jgi:hypothetical protein